MFVSKVNAFRTSDVRWGTYLESQTPAFSQRYEDLLPFSKKNYQIRISLPKHTRQVRMCMCALCWWSLFGVHLCNTMRVKCWLSALHSLRPLWKPLQGTSVFMWNVKFKAAFVQVLQKACVSPPQIPTWSCSSWLKRDFNSRSIPP